MTIKIIQVTPQIGENDLARKMKQAQEFLAKREQVRITLIVRGRQRGRKMSSLEFLQHIDETYFANLGSLTKPPTELNLSLTYNPASKH